MSSSLKYELCQRFQIWMIKVVPKTTPYCFAVLRLNGSPPVPISESIHTYFQNDNLGNTDSIILIYILFF